MKLSDITISDQQKIALQIGGAMLFVLAVAVLGIWFNAPNTTNVPAAEVLSQQSQAQHVESVIAEKEADAIGAQANAVDVERQKAIEAGNASRQRLSQTESKLKARKAEYDRTRKQSGTIDRSDLSDREHRLITELRSLYR